MGNRPGGSRSKSRENKYKYAKNYQNNVIPTNGVGGHGNHRPPSSQANGYAQHPYSNGYGQHSGGPVMGNTQSQYTISQTQHHQINNNTNPKSNSSKTTFLVFNFSKHISVL